MVLFQDISMKSEVGIQEILTNAKEFLKMAETVASAAEQLSSSAEEARKGTEQQTKAFSEMATAAEELATTAEELKNSTDLQKSAAELASMAEQLSANVEEASSASQELANAIEQIRQASEIQAEETQKGSELSDIILNKTKEVEENATNMQEQSEDISKKISVNKTNVDIFIGNITKAAEENLKAAENIRILDEATRKIEKIVETIMNVTIQTNMLAVSGSIEAARAGEHGKGFSVVANDIRNLANESAVNADKIKDMVRGLQFRIIKSTQDVELAGNTAKLEAEKAKVSTEVLLKIEQDMETIIDSMNLMIKNAKEAQAAIDQAKKGVEQISSAASESNNAVAQSASASEEQAKGLDDLSKAIEEIAALADELQTN